MRGFILVTLLIIHTSTATIDLQKLSEKAHSKLQELTDKASAGLHQITETIDLEKLQQLDFLNLIPRIQSRLSQIKPSPAEKLGYFLHKVQSLTGKGLGVAFDAGVPWPALRRMGED